MKRLVTISTDCTGTLEYYLEKLMLEDFEKLYELLSEMGIHFLLKPVNGSWLTEEDIESINKSLQEFELTYQNLDKLLLSPSDFTQNEILPNESLLKNLRRQYDCISLEYEDLKK
ncbi:MAG: hypothetical protein J5857_04070 [Treponema sp.]|nr:hypothetical protein [Treponema sp.]